MGSDEQWPWFNRPAPELTTPLDDRPSGRPPSGCWWLAGLLIGSWTVMVLIVAVVWRVVFG